MSSCRGTGRRWDKQPTVKPRKLRYQWLGYGQQARKNDKVQREARLAIAETFDAWIDWLEDEAPDQIQEMFFELGCFATATNRRRIFKYAKVPEGVAERAQEQVDQWKVEEKIANSSAVTVTAAETDAENGIQTAE